MPLACHGHIFLALTLHAATAAFPVLFVPLHQFNPAGDLIKAVEEFVRYDEYLKDNPLDPDNENLRLLVIFDGLDELALQGKLAKEVAQEFVREVQSKISRFNYRKTRLQVLITGREVAVQESFKEPSRFCMCCRTLCRRRSARKKMVNPI
jgi:hypothetical protein